MSRYTKAAPGGRCVVLDDGYQLCARCGEVHCTADRVVAVDRTSWWIIHTHLPGRGCPAKAVSGWRAVELALDSRELNIPTPREAFPVTISGFTLPFVSLLDNEHCTAEMEVVTIWRKEFLPSKLSLSEGDNDNHKLLSNLVENQGDRVGEPVSRSDSGLCPRRQPIGRKGGLGSSHPRDRMQHLTTLDSD